MAKREFKIPTGFLTRERLLSPKYFFKMFLEAGDIEGLEVSLTNNDMLDLGYSWILYQAKFEIERFPKAQETVIIETYTPKVDKLKAYRNVDIYDMDNNLIIKSTGVWLVASIEDETIVNLPDEVLKAYDIKGKPHFRKFEKFRNVKIDSEGEKRRTYKSDIDYNNHINSSNYIGWLTDSIERDDSKLESLEIYYRKEIKSTEEVVLKKQEIEEGVYMHEILGDNSPKAYAITKWKN